MKLTKILFAVLALVLVVSLVACGGEKTPDTTEPAETTAAPAATTTNAPAATTTAAPATTAAPVVTEAPAAAAPNTPEEYASLFVQDANVFHLNFAEATTASDPLVGSAYYEDETKSAYNRFNASAANYIPYIWNSTVENPVSGGTAKILTPWYFEDMYADWTVKFCTGKIEDMRTVEPLDYASTKTKNGQTVYVVNTYVEETEYYISNGEWAKKMYASQWGNGYLHLGLNSTLNFPAAAKAAHGNSTEFTVQFVVQKVGTSGSFATFLADRYNISGTAGKVVIKPTSSGTYYVGFQPVEAELETFDIYAVNDYTFTYDRANTSAVKLGIYVNTALVTEQTLEEKKMDEIFKIFEQSDSNVYAIRIYAKALSAEEVMQNHFADIATVCKLDVTEFLKLDDAAKAKVYEAMSVYGYDLPTTLLQKQLNSAIEAAK